MPENVIIDIYDNKSIKIYTIKEDNKCSEIWKNVLDCIKKNEDCTKKFFEWDKCIGNK